MTILVLGVVGENFWVALPFAALIGALLLIVLIRFGFLALCISMWYFNLLSNLPVTVNFSRWYIGRSLVLLMITIGLAVYGFRSALAGRPVFGNLILEE